MRVFFAIKKVEAIFFCANIGDGTTQFALAGSLGAYGLIFKDQKALRYRQSDVQASGWLPVQSFKF